MHEEVPHEDAYETPPVEGEESEDDVPPEIDDEDDEGYF